LRESVLRENPRGEQQESSAPVAKTTFLNDMSAEGQNALLLTDEIVFLDCHGNALTLCRFVHPENLSHAAHPDRIREGNFLRQRHYELNGRAGGYVGIQIHEDAARTHVTRVSGQFPLAIIQEFY
jgi:hypothetical protein